MTAASRPSRTSRFGRSRSVWIQIVSPSKSGASSARPHAARTAAGVEQIARLDDRRPGALVEPGEGSPTGRRTPSTDAAAARERTAPARRRPRLVVHEPVGVLVALDPPVHRPGQRKSSFGCPCATGFGHPQRDPLLEARQPDPLTLEVARPVGGTRQPDGQSSPRRNIALTVPRPTTEAASRPGPAAGPRVAVARGRRQSPARRRACAGARPEPRGKSTRIPVLASTRNRRVAEVRAGSSRHGHARPPHFAQRARTTQRRLWTTPPQHAPFVDSSGGVSGGVKGTDVRLPGLAGEPRRGRLAQVLGNRPEVLEGLPTGRPGRRRARLGAGPPIAAALLRQPRPALQVLTALLLLGGRAPVARCAGALDGTAGSTEASSISSSLAATPRGAGLAWVERTNRARPRPVVGAVLADPGRLGSNPPGPSSRRTQGRSEPHPPGLGPPATEHQGRHGGRARGGVRRPGTGGATARAAHPPAAG